MSDTWQGPGWRRADDGKWYPEAELTPPPPPPPAPAPPAASAPPESRPFAPPGGHPTPADLPPPATQQPLPPVPPPPAQYLPPPPPPGPGGPSDPGGPGGPGTSYGWMPAAPIRPVSTSLAGWLQGLFWAAAATSALTALASLNARSSFSDLMSSFSGSELTLYDSWVDADNLLGLVSLLVIPVRLALFVVLVVWTWKCHKAASSLNPGPRRWGSGWAIGAWFVPLAWFLLPKLVIDENEKIAMAPRSAGTAVDWKKTKVSGLGIAWWWLFVASVILAAVASNVDTTDAAGFADPDAIPTYYMMIIISGVLAAVSAVCGALFCKDLSRRLSSGSLHGADATGYRTVGTLAGAPASSVDQWAARASHATSFCAICREPLFDDMARCPRCGKRRQPATS